MEEDLHPNWKALSTSTLRWKVFVQARGEDPRPERDRNKACATSFTGEEAKEIYENITKKSAENDLAPMEDRSEVPNGTEASTSSGLINNCCLAKTKRKLTFDARSIHRAMMYAQNDEVASLTEMLENGFPVNSRDEHGWSLLMVAACAASFDVVRTLLKRKARTGIRDGKGNTAIYLASIKGHTRIVDLLIKSGKRKPPMQDEDVVEVIPSHVTYAEFFCDICQRTIKESTRIQHETSIVHQFNIGSDGNKTIYGISPSNKGYQLLVNQGWNTEKGLGPESSGVKFPVKTILKRNREGVGASSEDRARVTHFGPGDESAVKGPHSISRIMRLKTVGKKERRREQLKERNKDIEIRRMLNEPDL